MDLIYVDIEVLPRSLSNMCIYYWEYDVSVDMQEWCTTWTVCLKWRD